jgi:hypothetical protein
VIDLAGVRRASNRSILEPLNEAAQHASDFFELGLEELVVGRRYELASVRQFQERHAFLQRSPCDAEEMLSFPFGESAVSFGDVCGNRQCRPVQLIRKIAIPTGERLGTRSGLVREINGSLINEELLEGESHRATKRNAGEETAGKPVGQSEPWGRPAFVCSTFYFLLSPALFSPLCGENGG